MNLSS
jgi:hypothetical protein